MIKNVKRGIKYKYFDCFLEYKNFKDDVIGYKCLCCNKNYQNKFHEKLKERHLINSNFITKTIISFFYCSEKVFSLMNIWIIGKNSVNHLT